MFTNAVGCDSIVALHLTINLAPETLTLNGVTLIDANQNPTNTYTIDGNTNAAALQWSIDPEEAGTIETEENAATIVWNVAFSGEAVIKAIAQNDCGETEVELTVSVVTDVEEHNINANVYPNPTNGIITVEVVNIERVTVSNMLGQILVDEAIESNATQLNLGQFAPGTYLVRVYTQNGIALKKVNVIR